MFQEGWGYLFSQMVKVVGLEAIKQSNPKTPSLENWFNLSKDQPESWLKQKPKDVDRTE